MMKEFRKFTTMAQIIEARVKQKTGTEAEWLSATIPVLPGEQAFVTDRYNFKLNTSKTPKMFKDLEYFYKGDIIGSVSPEENLDSKIDGVYRAKVAGEYAGVSVKEGYYTLLRKKNGVWSIESEVKVDIEDTTKIDLKDGEFLVGTASGVNVGRKITGSDIIKKQGGGFNYRQNIPVYNSSTNEWTQGIGFSIEASNYTLAHRTSMGQIKAKDGFSDDHVATYGQMPIKRFKNAKLAEEYAAEKGKRGELVIIEEEDAVYRIDKWDNLVLLIDEEGSVDSFISLSDTPDNFPIDRGGYFVRYDEGGKLVFDRFRHADVGIEPERSARQVVATDENSDFKSISYSVNPSGNTIPLRKSGGALAVGDPISDEDAVPYYMFDGLAKTDGSNIDKEKFKDALDIQDVETKDTNISITKDYTEWGISDGDNLQKFNDKVYDEIVNMEDYTLPVATKETLGGVIVGENLNINSLGELNALNTTYEKGTLEQLVSGESVTGKVWDAKTLQEWSGDLAYINREGENEVGEEFSLKKGNATLIFDEDWLIYESGLYEVLIGDTGDDTMLQFYKKNIGTNGEGYSYFISKSGFKLYANGLQPLWEIRANSDGQMLVNLPTTGSESKTLAVSWNGVFADEEGNIDADLTPYIDDYFDKEKLTLKNIPDKTNDATFNQLVGMNNVTKELGIVGGSSAVNSILAMGNDDPALIALTYKLNGTFTSSTRITTNGVFPPVLAEGNGIKTLTILGKGLTLPEDENITKVQIVHLQTMNIYDVGWKNIKDNSLEVYVNSSLYPLGEYKIKILSGVQAHITQTSFEILDASSVTEIPTNSLVWEWYKNSQSTITEEQSGIDVIEPNVVRSNQVGSFGQSDGRVQDTLISNIINDVGNFTITAEVFFDMPIGEYRNNAFGIVKDLNHETSVVSYPYGVGSLTKGQSGSNPPMQGVSVGFRYNGSAHNFSVGRSDQTGSQGSNKYPNGKGVETLIITRKGNKLYTSFGEWIYVEDVNQSELFRLAIVNCVAPASSNQMEVKIKQIQTFRSELYRE